MLLSRRHFLVQAGVTLTAVRSLGCDGTDSEEATGPIPAGNLNAVPLNHLAAVGDKPVALGRDAGGLYAMTTICTHQRCNIASGGTITPEGLACSCHGSRFSRTGAVTSGPATTPLKHYKVDLAPDGAITVQADTIVDAATRTAVPA
jgi:Rieske Fe-S protein